MSQFAMRNLAHILEEICSLELGLEKKNERNYVFLCMSGGKFRGV